MTITFTAASGMAAIGSQDNDAIRIAIGDTLRAELFYDFKEAPLVLSAPVKPGDRIELVIGNCRDELWVNDRLYDEEWCCGKLLPGREVSGSISIALEISESAAVHAPEPLKMGVGLEELRGYGVNVGDCMPYADDERFHIFWLYDRHHHHSKWGLGAHQWAHASSEDLIHWDEQPMAVAITDPMEGSICTGSVIRAEDGWRAWYTVRMSDQSPARVSCAVSADNSAYTKTGEYFVLPERYHRPSARDPKAVLRDGKYHLILTTTELSSGRGCLAHLISDYPDMRDFKDLGPLLIWEDGNQPECPDWFEMGEYYYLVWSIGARAHYAYSSDPFGESGWIIPEDNIIDCGSVPKSALAPSGKWKGERIFVGFVCEGGYAGHFVMKRAAQASDGRIELMDM